MQVGEILSVESVTRPKFATPSRSKDPLLRAGLAYEKKFGKWLGKNLAWDILPGPWFLVEDEGGEYYKQPDFVARFKTHAIVLETKLTQSNRGDAQLREYAPIIQAWVGLPVLKIQVFKNARYAPEGRRFAHLSEAVGCPDFSPIHVFQWIP